MGPQAEFYLGAPRCRQYDWLLSKLDYSHTINLTHPLSVLFVVAVLLKSYHCLPACFHPSVIFNCNSNKSGQVLICTLTFKVLSGKLNVVS